MTFDYTGTVCGSTSFSNGLVQRERFFFVQNSVSINYFFVVWKQSYPIQLESDLISHLIL